MNKALIKYYFKLQYRMMERQLSDFGLWPKTALALLTILLGVGIYLLKTRTDYAGFILAILAISFFSRAAEQKRNDFLSIHLSTIDRRVIRIIENIIITLPFTIGLFCYGDYLIAGAVFILALILSLVSLRVPDTHVLLTPFYRFPFETIVGFRSTFILVLIAYFLLYKGISVGNMNLAFSSMALVFISMISYYATLESGQLVWIFRKNPRSFLSHKAIIALGAAVILCSPVVLALSIHYPDRTWIVLGLFGLGYAYVLCFLLAKYAAYPHALTVPFTVIIVSSFLFPPLLLVLIPFLYHRSIRSLRPYL